MNAATILGCRVVLMLWSSASGAQEWTSAGPEGGYVSEIYASRSSSSLVFAMTPGGLFRSLDTGDSWRRAENGIASTVGPFAASYASSGDLFAFDPLDDQSAYIIDSAGILYRTEDAGDHWSPTGFQLADSQPESMAVDRSVPRHLYLATTRGILRSPDGGATFELITGSLASGPVTAIAVDPTDNNHVLIGGPYVPGSPLFNYSVDGGDHWSNANSPCDALEACGFVHDLRYAGGSHWVATADKLLDSSDGGMSWIAPEDSNANGVSATTDFSVLIAGAFGVAFTPDGFQTFSYETTAPSLDGTTPLQTLSAQIFADYPNAGPWFVGTFIAGLYRSEDMGSQWASVNAGLVATDIRALAIDPSDSSRALAGDFTGGFTGEGNRSLYSSSDGGASWSAAATPPPARYVRAIAYDPTTHRPNSTVYAVGFYAGFGDVHRNSGLYKSTNSGEDWTVMDNGLPMAGNPPHGYIGGVRGLALDPRSCLTPPPTGPCTTGPLQVLYAAASGSYVDDNHSFRVVKSVDAGAHWTSSDDGLPATTYFQNGDYEDVITYRLLVNAEDSNIVYATTWLEASAGHASSPGIESGVFRSDDGGAHWSFRSEGLARYPGSVNTALDVLALVADPDDPDTLWAGMTDGFGTSPGAVYKTDDGGAHWANTSIGLQLKAVRAIAIDSRDGSLYAGGDPVSGSRDSIFWSTDAGAHWTAVANAPPTRTLNELVADPNQRAHLLAGTTGGVWHKGDQIFRNGFDP